MVISYSLSDEQLLAAIHDSAIAYSRLLNQTFLFIGKRRPNEFLWFQCTFQKKNFMHLLGINSETLTADSFYEHAIKDCLLFSDCSASRNHSRGTINAKCSCCAEMLNISNAKYLNIGEKDKISMHMDFDYAYGNIATLGFLQSSAGICYPITLLPINIDELTSSRYRILFVCKKDTDEIFYKEPVIEIKNGIFAELFPAFPRELKILFENENGPVG